MTNHSMGCPVILIYAILYDGDISAIERFIYFLHYCITCRSGRGRKLSGDQITLPTTVDFSQSVPKQVSIVFKKQPPAKFRAECFKLQI